MDDSVSLGIFGNVLNYDLSHGVDFGTGLIPHSPDSDAIGNILHLDFSHGHIDTCPILTNFVGNQHLLTHDMTRLRNRMLFTIKFAFQSLFKRNRKGAMLLLQGLTEEEKKLIME